MAWKKEKCLYCRQRIAVARMSQHVKAKHSDSSSVAAAINYITDNREEISNHLKSTTQIAQSDVEATKEAAALQTHREFLQMIVDDITTIVRDMSLPDMLDVFNRVARHRIQEFGDELKRIGELW